MNCSTYSNWWTHKILTMTFDIDPHLFKDIISFLFIKMSVKPVQFVSVVEFSVQIVTH